MINAEEFSPMRGHVASGMQVRFPSRTLQLLGTMGGWVLVDGYGRWQTPPCNAGEMNACVQRLLAEDKARATRLDSVPE